MSEVTGDSLKRASFTKAFNESYWAWRRNPAIIVPTMFNSALDIIRQAVAFIPLILALNQLLADGSLNRIADRFSSQDLQGLVEELTSPHVSSILMPTLLIIAASIIVVTIIGGGFVASAEFGSYRRIVEDQRIMIGDVLIELGRRWKKMAWTLLLSNLIIYAPVALGLLYFISRFSTISEFTTILSAGIVLLVSGIATLVINLFMIYVYPSVAFEEEGGFKAVRRSFRTASRFFLQTVSYGIVRVVSLILIGLTAFIAQSFGVSISTFLVLVLTFAITPILHMTKTVLYNDTREERLGEYMIYPHIPLDLLDHTVDIVLHKVRIGLGELRRFVSMSQNIPYHITSIIALVSGLYLGREFGSSGLADLIYTLGYQPGRISPELQRMLPPFFSIDIFLHNWQVSISTALSGLGLLAPAVLTLIFNGFIIGVVVSLIPDPKMLLSALLPHGVIEIPSFLIAGSVGIRLGVTLIRALGKKRVTEDPRVQKALLQAVYVIVGLAPFFLLAGLIEGMVTPMIMKLFGWK